MAGFIYQLYYYMERLLLLGPGEAASFEVFNDVAVEKDGQMRNFQLKHTSTANKTTSVRMCDRDRDLWMCSDILTLERSRRTAYSTI